MNGELSGLAEHQLRDWLTEVRRIGTLPEEEALTALDTMAWGLSEAVAHAETDGSWGGGISDSMERLRVQIGHARRAIQHRQSVSVWEPDRLRREAEDLGRFATPAERTSFATEIEALKREALTTADDLAGAWHLTCLERALTTPFARWPQVHQAVKTVQDALGALRQLQRCEPDVERMGHAALERAARWRSDKRLAEAEVAEAGGKNAKAVQYRAEAAVMLRQDLRLARLDGSDSL